MRILFVSATRLGDAVLTCGVLDSLIRRYPQARFTVACGPAAAGAFARMPQLERLLVVDKRRNDSHWFKLWRQVAFTLWDLVVDIRGSALAYLLPAKRRVVRRPRRGLVFEQHAAMLGIDPAPLPMVWTAPADRAKAAVLLPSGHRYVGFGATANWGPKMWPLDRFAELFGHLRTGRLADAVPVVFAGPGSTEAALAAPLLAALPEAIDLVGKLDIAEVAATIQRCALYVGNDSGLMHVAAAAGTPTIGLFGPTLDRAEEMAPAGPHAALVGSAGTTMERISVDQVYLACVRLLDEAAISAGVDPQPAR